MGKSQTWANSTKQMGKPSREMGMSYQDTNTNFLGQSASPIIFVKTGLVITVTEKLLPKEI